MPFLGNAWYVACFAGEVTDDTLLARTICGTAMLLYRDSEGALVAMRDACPHRSAPHSRGLYRDGVVSCRYHGLAYGRGGACVANPHGPITAALAGRRWPAAERHGFAWVWPGDKDRADEGLIPANGHRPRSTASWRCKGSFRTPSPRSSGARRRSCSCLSA